MSEVPALYKAQVEQVRQMLRVQMVPARSGALPAKQYISITETLTWLAFGVPLEDWAFHTAEQFAIGPFGQREQFLSSMQDALQQFVDKAAGGLLAVRGRYVANYSDHGDARNAETRVMTPEELRGFARYDSLYGGLEHGCGFTWEEQSLDVILDGRRDGWREVEVRKSELESTFQPGSPIVPGHDEAVRRCIEWLERNGRSGERAAWPAFRSAFPGATRDDVFRPAFKEAKGKKSRQ